MVADVEVVQIVYIIVAVIATGASSYLNWKTENADEPFNAKKFLSAYVRTVWAIIPSIYLLSTTYGLTFEGIFTMVTLSFGVDNATLKVSSSKSNNAIQTKLK